MPKEAPSKGLFSTKSLTSEEISKKKLSKETEMFLKGSKVEVRSEDEGLKGAWYVAKILEEPTPTSAKKHKRRVCVEYESFVSEDDEDKLLIETVDVRMIRPLPPWLQHFEVYDVVDAFYRDGWWKGVVLKVGDFEGENKKMCKRYTVVFDDPYEQIEFDASRLRVHFDWVNGSWIRQPKQKRIKGLKFSIGMAVEVKPEEECLEDDPWFPATILQEAGFDSFLVSLVEFDDPCLENKRVTVDPFSIRPPPPNAKIDKFNLSDEVDVLYGSAWRCGGIIKKRLTKGWYSVFLKHESQGKQERIFTHSELRPHKDFINGNWVTNSMDAMDSANDLEPSRRADNNPKSSKIAIQLESSDAAMDSTPEGRASFGSSGKNTVQQSASPGSVTRFSNPAKKFRRENSANCLSSRVSLVKSAPEQKPKEELETTINTLTRCSSRQLVSDEPFGENEHQFRESNQQKNGVKDEILISEKEHEMVSNSQVKGHPILSTGVVAMQENNGDQNENIVSAEELGIPTDSAVERNLVQTAGDEQRVARDGASGMETEDSAAKLASLPFEKNSPVWKVVESLEVFQSIPQKPHFHPLFSHEDQLSREGLAIGQMVNFGNLVAQTSKLRANSPLEMFTSCLGSSTDLKTYGFDVKTVVDRLNELLSIKDRRKHLADQSKKLELEIADCTLVQKKMEEVVSANNKKIREQLSEISELEEKIREAKKKLKEAKEERAWDMSIMESKHLFVAKLQHEYGAISKRIAETDQDFERVATAPW